MPKQPHADSWLATHVHLVVDLLNAAQAWQARVLGREVLKPVVPHSAVTCATTAAPLM